MSFIISYYGYLERLQLFTPSGSFSTEKTLIWLSYLLITVSLVKDLFWGQFPVMELSV